MPSSLKVSRAYHVFPSLQTPRRLLESSCCQLTYHRLQHTLGDFNELLVDLNGKVTQHLTVFSEVEVLKTVLILLGRVPSHEALQGRGVLYRGVCGRPGSGLPGSPSLSQCPSYGVLAGSLHL